MVRSRSVPKKQKPKLPKPGDRVLVPWGFHILEARVIRVSDFGIGPQITVEIDMDGVDEPMFNTYAADRVEVVPAA